jgi:hypothetical protein
MAIRKELTLVLENKPGAAARVFKGLADDRINILAMQLEHTGLLRLVVDNPLHAAELMREADAGVNVEYLYVTAVEGLAMAAVVIGVPDAMKASAAAGI